MATRNGKAAKADLNISTVDELDHIRAKIEFLMHTKTGRFSDSLSENAAFGELLILSECSDRLKAIGATVQAHVQGGA